MHRNAAIAAGATALCALFALVGAGAETWVNVTKEAEPELPGNEIQFLERGSDGRVWIGMLSGLALFRDGKYVSIKDDEGKPLRLSAWDVLEVDKNRFWVGHGNGVSLLENDKTVSSALKGQTVAPIQRFGEDKLWAIGKNRGSEQNTLFQFADGAWSPVEALKDRRVVDMMTAGDGTIWLAIDGDGIFEVDPGQASDEWVHHLQGMNVTTMAVDSKGRVWCGLWERGVMVYSKGAWEKHLARSRSAFLAIAEDARAAIWVATNDSGLWRYDGVKWVNDLKDEGAISLLATTSDGRVWVSSQVQGGLRYWDGAKWELSLDSPLPIRCVFEAPGGEVWAGGVLDGIHIRK